MFWLRNIERPHIFTIDLKGDIMSVVSRYYKHPPKSFFFLLYINDTSTSFVSPVRLSANDVSFYVIVEDDIFYSAYFSTNDLRKIKQWFKTWSVDYNPSKTVNLDFTMKNICHTKISFGKNGPNIQNVKTHTLLGIKFQKDGS